MIQAPLCGKSGNGLACMELQGKITFQAFRYLPRMVGGVRFDCRCDHSEVWSAVHVTTSFRTLYFSRLSREEKQRLGFTGIIAWMD